MVNFKDFKILQLLGEGSFGKVFLVTMPHATAPANFPKEFMDKYIALKLMKKALLTKHESHTTNERKILAACRHPFILEYYFTINDPVNLYLATEIATGGEVYRILQSQPKAQAPFKGPDGFPESTVRFFSAQVIMAFDYLHKNNVIYRDLKPENILLNDDGYLKVADLGFAKYIGNSVTHTFCGTIEYMAPEVFAVATSSKGYGKSMDWWGVGILIFELFFGRAPWPPTQANPLEHFKWMQTKKLTFPNSKKPYTELKDLVSKLLQHDPSRRLGCMAAGTTDIVTHQFFARERLAGEPFSFRTLFEKKLTPPFRPPEFVPKAQEKLIRKCKEEAAKYLDQRDNYANQFHGW